MLIFCILLLIENIMRCAGAKFEGKIIGGAISNVQRFPHAVFLNTDCAGPSFCGGSVLNQRIVLTAGHCLESCDDPTDVDAFAGSSDYTKSHVLRTAIKLKTHENYDHHTMFCDISMVFLNKRMPLGPTIQRIILGHHFSVGVEAYTAGWGIISEDGDTGELLKEVRQKVISIQRCNKLLVIKWGMMCVTSVRSNEYPDEGDSGSALIAAGAQQIGIVSMKARITGNANLIYTNITCFKSWIYTHRRKLFCPYA